MNPIQFISTLALSTLVTGSVFANENEQWNRNWPQWRGPTGNGVAPGTAPPLQWSETRNVKWKVAIPGSGLATPIVWDDKVFLLTAIPTGKNPDAARAGSGDATPGNLDEIYQFSVLCIDRETGETLWQKVAREAVPHEGHHRDSGFASASPSTDGKSLIAYFGSRGLYCYDLDGNLNWETDFGEMQVRNAFGEGSSAALHENTVLVLWDHEGDDDFIAAVDKDSGREIWRTPRVERTSWTTPLVVEVDGEPQAIVAGTTGVRGYDLATGREIWTGPELTMNVVPTPVHSDGVVYAMSGFRGSFLHAIKLGGTGDLTGTDAVLWSLNRNTPYVPSPVLVDDRIYFASGNNAILSCFDTTTGEPHFVAERLEGINGIYASPVAANGRIYVLGRKGTCLVLEDGPDLKIMATNRLEDKTDASIAIAGDELFIRGHKHLYCIAED